MLFVLYVLSIAFNKKIKITKAIQNMRQRGVENSTLIIRNEIFHILIFAKAPSIRI